MTRLVSFTMALASCLLAAGCVLPVPHRRVHQEGINAKVVDAQNGSPVSGARITDPVGNKVLTQTDARGLFEIPSIHGWHGAYLVGPISYSLLPHFDMTSRCPPFRVDAGGYLPTTVSPGGEERREDDTGRTVIPLLPDSAASD